MKYYLLLMFALILMSCEQKTTSEKKVEQQYRIEQPIYKSVYKVVKDLKEKTEQHTSNEYEMDWWKMEPKLMPNVHTNTKYIVVYTDKSFEELSYDRWIILSKGDTVYRRIKVN